MQQSLKELKAENAAKTESENTEIADDYQEEITPKEAEAEPVESAVTEEPSEDEGESQGEPEIESWMQSEEATHEDDQNSGFKPNHEAAKRRKQAQALKGQLKEKDTKLEELQKQVEMLQAGMQPKSQETEALTLPTREQFDFDDDAFDAATAKYYESLIDRKLATSKQASYQEQEQQAAMKRAQEAQSKSLSDHYERAQKLVDEGKVTEESYRNADLSVRNTLETMFPERGNAIAEGLIANLNNVGSDSEKVMYQLGVNPAKMQQFQNLLHSDPSGMSAMAFLGGLQNDISAPKKTKKQRTSTSKEN